MRKLIVLMLFALTFGFVNVSAAPIGYNGPATRTKEMYAEAEVQTVHETLNLSESQTINKLGLTTVNPGGGTPILSYHAKVVLDETLNSNVLELFTKNENGTGGGRYAITKTGTIANALPNDSTSTGNHTALHFKFNSCNSKTMLFAVEAYTRQGGKAGGVNTSLGRLFQLRWVSGAEKFYFGDNETTGRIPSQEWADFERNKWYDFTILFLDNGTAAEDKVVYYVDGVKMYEHTGLTVDFNKNISDLLIHTQANNADTNTLKIAHMFGETYNPIASFGAGEDIIATQEANLLDVINVVGTDSAYKATLADYVNISIPAEHASNLTYNATTKKFTAANVTEKTVVPVTVTTGESTVTATVNVTILPKVDVTMTTKLDDTVKEVVTVANTLGGTYTVNPTVAGGTFMFWTLNGAVRTDLPQNLTIQVQSKMDLVAHFASADKYSVVFLDTNSKLLKANFVGSSNPIELPDSNPSKQGLIFKGWASMIGYETNEPIVTPENPGSKTFYVAKYEHTNYATQYSIIVDGEVLYTKQEGRVATITSSNPNFSYWICADTGAILSYKSTYSFTVVNEHVRILTVTNEGTKSDPMVSIRRDIAYKFPTQETFIGHYELDETLYELIEVGFIHDGHVGITHISKSINYETNEFMMSAPTATHSYNEYKMRSYMTYKVKATGEIITIKNKSRYEVNLKVEVTGAANDTIYAIGDFNAWSFTSGYVILEKNNETGKHVATTPIYIIGEPGYTLKYKYVSSTAAHDPLINFETGGWEFGQNQELDNEIWLTGTRNKTTNDNINGFKNHPDDPFDANKIRIYVEDKNNYGIDTFHLHIFDTGGTDTTWRGLPITKKSLNGYYYIDYEKPVNTTFGIVINWNATGSEKTNDITTTKAETFISVLGNLSHNLYPVPKWDPNYIAP